MKTSIKITISIAALLVVLVAVFFAAPYTDYKKAKAEGKASNYFSMLCTLVENKIPR